MVLRDSLFEGVLVLNARGGISFDDWKGVQEVFKDCQPKKVLEFGCGVSTMLMLENNVNLTSLESKKGWADTVNAELRVKNLPAKILVWDNKTDNIVKDKFDLVIIDGQSPRDTQLKEAARVANRILVHDGQRDYTLIRKYLPEQEWTDVTLKAMGCRFKYFARHGVKIPEQPRKIRPEQRWDIVPPGPAPENEPKNEQLTTGEHMESQENNKKDEPENEPFLDTLYESYPEDEKMRRSDLQAMSEEKPQIPKIFEMSMEIVLPGDPTAEEMKTPEWKEYYKIKYNICKQQAPKRIAEIGVRAGYSAWAFLQAAPDAEYYGFDANNESYGGQGQKQYGYWAWAHKILEPYKATLIEIDTQAIEHIDLRDVDFFHVDGDHSLKGAMHDMDMAFECLRTGGLMLIDDVKFINDVRNAVARWIHFHEELIRHEFKPSLRGEVLIWKEKTG